MTTRSLAGWLVLSLALAVVDGCNCGRPLVGAGVVSPQQIALTDVVAVDDAGAVDAGPGACTPSSCPDGCCAGDICAVGTTAASCGRDGGVCQVCGAQQVCADGACCTPECGSCGVSDGCGGICDVGVCADGQTCANHHCTCTAASCATGCCAGDSCEPGTSVTACGSPGGMCTACGAGQSCVDGACCTPSCSACGGADGCGGVCDAGACAAGQACLDGGCVCTASSCPTGCCDGDTCETGASTTACGLPGGLCAACEAGQTCVDGACCTPSCSATSCGGPDGCGGTCPACCSQCQVGTNSCALTTAPFLSDGGCPAGFSFPAPACTPCWTCAAGDAYCDAPGDCGTWTTNAIVGADQTCYGCEGFGYATTANAACYNAQQNTLADSATAGGTCPWPSGALSSLCGFAGGGYVGSSPVQAGGCDYCSFSCGSDTTTCCVPKDWSVTSAAQCCSGMMGACAGGTGTNCCQ